LSSEETEGASSAAATQGGKKDDECNFDFITDFYALTVCYTSWFKVE